MADPQQHRSDEELVQLAQTDPHDPAVTTLVQRYFVLACGWLDRLPRPGWFRQQDLQDAQQGTFFVLLKAITSFDGRPQGKATWCSFHTFFCALLTNYFRDAIRHLHRRQRRQQSLGDAVADLQLATKFLSVLSPGELTWGTGTDPAWASEQQEMLELLHRAADQLPSTQRRLWEGRREGKSLTELAAELRLPYRQVCRLWKHLLAHFAAVLKDWMA